MGVQLILQRTMNLTQRAKALASLVYDARQLHFSRGLIKEYENQLREVQRELRRAKYKSLKFRIVRYES